MSYGGRDVSQQRKEHDYGFPFIQVSQGQNCRAVKKSENNLVWISEAFLITVNRKCKVYGIRDCLESSRDILEDTREQCKGRRGLLCSALNSQDCCMATARESVASERSWLTTISSTRKKENRERTRTEDRK